LGGGVSCPQAGSENAAATKTMPMEVLLIANFISYAPAF
jgi:hypothetical protein